MVVSDHKLHPPSPQTSTSQSTSVTKPRLFPKITIQTAEDHDSDSAAPKQDSVVEQGTLGPTLSFRSLGARKRLRAAVRLIAFGVRASAMLNELVVETKAHQLMTMRMLQRFVPRFVLRRGNLTDLDLSRKPEVSQVDGTVLFADLSGFSRRAETLLKEREQRDDRSAAHVGTSVVAHEVDAADNLRSYANMFFNQVISEVHSRGGDIIRIAGDAVFAVFEGQSDPSIDSLHAVDCAIAIQAALKDLISVHGSISCKIGIAHGKANKFFLGGAAGRWQFLFAGEALTDAARAMELAGAGKTVVTTETLKRIRQRAEVGATPVDKGHSSVETVQSVKSVPTPTTTATLQAQDSQELLQGATLSGTTAYLRSFVPESVLVHAGGGIENEWLGELRRLTVVFILVDTEFLDLSQTNGLETLQRVFLRMQQAIYHHDAIIKEFSVDDKGLVLVAGFGCPPLAHDDDPVRAVTAAARIHYDLGLQNIKCHIGVATGEVFCGAVGNEKRAEYAMVGRTVNLAARLMSVMQKTGCGIAVGSATYQATKECIEFSPYEPMKLKGIDVPVQAFQPIRASSISTELSERLHPHVWALDVLVKFLGDQSKTSDTEVVQMHGSLAPSIALELVQQACVRAKCHVLNATHRATVDDTRQDSWAAYSLVLAETMGDVPYKSRVERQGNLVNFVSETLPEYSELWSLLEEVLNMGPVAQTTNSSPGPDQENKNGLDSDMQFAAHWGSAEGIHAGNSRGKQTPLQRDQLPEGVLPSLKELAPDFTGEGHILDSMSVSQREFAQMTMVLACLLTVSRPCVVLFEVPTSNLIARKMIQFLEFVTEKETGLILCFVGYRESTVPGWRCEPLATGHSILSRTILDLKLSPPDRNTFENHVLQAMNASSLDVDLCQYIFVRTGANVSFAIDLIRNLRFSGNVIDDEGHLKFGPRATDKQVQAPYSIHQEMTRLLDRLDADQSLLIKVCSLLEPGFEISDVVVAFPDDLHVETIEVFVQDLVDMGVLGAQARATASLDSPSPSAHSPTQASQTEFPSPPNDGLSSRHLTAHGTPDRVGLLKSDSFRMPGSPSPLTGRRGRATRLRRVIPTAGNMRYRFRSLVLQEVLYRSLPLAVRIEAHRQSFYRLCTRLGIRSEMPPNSDATLELHRTVELLTSSQNIPDETMLFCTYHLCGAGATTLAGTMLSGRRSSSGADMKELMTQQTIQVYGTCSTIKKTEWVLLCASSIPWLVDWLPIALSENQPSARRLSEGPIPPIEPTPPEFEAISKTKQSDEKEALNPMPNAKARAPLIHSFPPAHSSWHTQVQSTASASTNERAARDREHAKRVHARRGLFTSDDGSKTQPSHAISLGSVRAPHCALQPVQPSAHAPRVSTGIASAQDSVPQPPLYPNSGADKCSPKLRPLRKPSRSTDFLARLVINSQVKSQEPVDSVKVICQASPYALPADRLTVIKKPTAHSVSPRPVAPPLANWRVHQTPRRFEKTSFNSFKAQRRNKNRIRRSES